MNTYRTAEVAEIIGIHPNTVRLYEKLELIPEPERLPNGYRIFTDLHLAQLRLIRVAFEVEVLQNGLRKRVNEILKTSAAGDFENAFNLTLGYLKQVRQEHANAEEATVLARQLLCGAVRKNLHHFRRKEVSEYLDISIDTLRNWEMNGLLKVKRKANGYRIYTENDICRLKIIRSLRCANFSLEAILRMLNQLTRKPHANILRVLDTADENSDVFSAYDTLITSLTKAEKNALTMLTMLQDMKVQYSQPSTIPPMF